ncbi:MAG: hemagglutinin [Synechococcus sp.]|nr:hemagglutinin [Synechococcus sp.]
MKLTFVPIHVFRQTPQVTFFDASVPHANGSDVVVHEGPATSPPDDGEYPQFYRHSHQVDHNLVLSGTRTFVLLNPAWEQPHHVVHLQRAMGALQIPLGTLHRSTSGEEGSLVLNQSVRDPEFSYATEFIPVSLRDREDLQGLLATAPWVWSWREGHIHRGHG